MPIYNTLGPTDLRPGQIFAMFNAETLTAPAKGLAIAAGVGPDGLDNGTTFQVSFAAAPTAQLEIQGSMVDNDASYVTLWSVPAGAQSAGFTDTQRFSFYRALLSSQSAGGAVTVIAKR